MHLPRLSRSALFAAASWAALLGAAHAQTVEQNADGAEQQSPARSQDRPTVVDEIIITGAPFGISQDATTIATTVVGEDELAVAPSASLGDFLNGTPGVRSTAFAPGASRPVIRGLTGPRVQVLTNGVGMIDASSVSPDHQVASDPAEANRIEIIRGPATLTYGGTAIGGVVNILDGRIPEQRPEGRLDGHVSAQVSSVDEGSSFSGRTDIGIGDFVLHLDALRRESDDYDVPVPAISQALADAEGIPRGDVGALPNSSQETEAFGLGGSYIGDWGFAGLSFKDTSSNYGVVAEESVFIELEQQRFDARGEYRFLSGPFSAVRATFGQADYTHTEFEDVGEPGTIFASDGWEARADLVQADRNGWNGATGVQALSRSFSAVGDEAYVPTTEIEESGIYTVQRIDLDRFGFEGGLRLDQRSLSATPLGTATHLDLEFANWSASGSVFFRPAPDWFLGLSLSRNARAPSEVELFADGLHIATAAYERGDPSFDSESAVTVEGTIHYDGGPFHADLHVYSSNYDSFIDSRDTGTNFSFIEDGVLEEFPIFAYVQTDAEFRGFELESALDVWRSGDRVVTLEAAADYVDADTDLGPAARIPPYSVSGRVRYGSDQVDANLEIRHVGEQGELASFELPTDDYTLVNVFGAWRPFANRGLTLFAQARNLTDEEAREHASFLKDIAPQPGRNLRIGLTYSF